MESKLFRKKSLNRISSPEELHDRLCVTSPRLWMTLSAIAALLIGFIVYAATATVENIAHIQVEVSNNDYSDYNEQGEYVEDKWQSAVAWLPNDYMGILETGMEVRIGNERGRLESMLSLEMESHEGNFAVLFEMDQSTVYLSDGIYDADLVLESATPISFLWN